MLPRWLGTLCAAVLAAGCGSSSGRDEASPDGTAAATASPSATATETPTVRRSDLARLGQAPAAERQPSKLRVSIRFSPKGGAAVTQALAITLKR